MSINRIIILLLVLSSFIAIAAGQEYYQRTWSVEYGQDDTLEASCAPRSECGYDVELRMCGENVPASTTEEQIRTGPNTITDGYRYTVEGLIAPEEFGCGQGDETYYVIDYSVYEVGDVTVEPMGDMNPHNGSHMVVNIDTSEDRELRNFLLTNDQWEDGPKESAPSIMVQEYDSKDRYNYEAKDGVIESSFTDKKISDILGSDYVVNCDGVEGGTCEVVDLEFGFSTTDDFTYGDVSGSFTLFDWELDTASPVHRNGDYIPDGEIIVGRQPSHYIETEDGDGVTTKEASDRKFFICREGARMQDGYGGSTSQVVQIGDDTDQLYKCNEPNEEWEPVTECSSGLDHDGDGDIDYPDDKDCDNEDHPTESMSTDCIERIELENIDDNQQRVAYFNGNWTGSDCNYQTDTSEGYTGEPEVFQCYNETDVNNKLENQGQLTQVQANYCNNEISPGHFEDHQYNTTFELDGEEIDVYQMPTVQYYINREFLPLTSEDRTEATKYVDDSPESDGGGFDNRKFQTLQEAMERYYRPSLVDPDNEPYEEGSCRLYPMGIRCTSTEHHPASYSNTNVGMNELDGYENRNPENYLDSWIVANAGETSDDILSIGTNITDSRLFPGGFAGKCTDIEWRYSFNWKCTEYTGQETELTASFYNVQGAGDTFEGVDAGFELSSNQISNWRLAHPFAPSEGNISGVEPLQVNGQCWVGERDQRPTDMSQVVNITSTVESEDEPLYVIGELPARDKDAEFSSQRYSCLFGFTQKITDLDLVPHNSITTFVDGEPVNVETDEDGENTYTDSDGEEISEAYLTEGSQEAGQILIDTRTIVPTSGYNLDWLHQRSANYEQQEDQEPQIGTAELISEGDDPWPHHYTGGAGDGFDSSGEEPARHPVTVWSDEEIN